MYRISKFDDVLHKALYAAPTTRPDVEAYLSLKQAIIDKYQKKIMKHHRRMNKKTNVPQVRSDLETQRLNLIAQGEDSEQLKQDIAELKRKYPGHIGLYDSNKIPILNK